MIINKIKKKNNNKNYEHVRSLCLETFQFEWKNNTSKVKFRRNLKLVYETNKPEKHSKKKMGKMLILTT